MGSGVGGLERLNKFLVDPICVGVGFLAAADQFSFTREEIRLNSTDLLSVACSSLICDIIPRTRLMMSRQSVVTDTGGAGSSGRE